MEILTLLPPILRVTSVSKEYEMETDVIASLKSSQYNRTPNYLLQVIAIDFLPICILNTATKTLLSDIGHSKYHTGHFFGHGCQHETCR